MQYAESDMPKTPIIAQPAKLRDTVYERLRDDIQAEAFPAEQRFVETELAARYGVSRTPIREALLQLSREGMLIPGERGYSVPIDTRKDVTERLEVRLLLDVRIARHVALAADAAALRTLTRLYDRATVAHAADRHKAFVTAQKAFREALRATCPNRLLARCAAMVDENFQTVRNRLHRSAENRSLTLASDARLLAAIAAADAEAAETETRAFIEAVHSFHLGTLARNM